MWHVVITKTIFSFNKNNLISFVINGDVSVQLRELDINNNNNFYGENLLEFKSGFDTNIRTPVQLDTNQLDKAEILIIRSRFTNNYYMSVNLMPSTPMIIIT